MTDYYKKAFFSPETKWEIWHRDTFDRETPATKEREGVNVDKGLRELWNCILREGITDGGTASFSDFSMEWKNGKEFGQIGFSVDDARGSGAIELSKLKTWWKQDKNCVAERVSKRHKNVIESNGLKNYDYRSCAELISSIKNVNDPKTL